MKRRPSEPVRDVRLRNRVEPVPGKRSVRREPRYGPRAARLSVDQPLFHDFEGERLPLNRRPERHSSLCLAVPENDQVNARDRDRYGRNSAQGVQRAVRQGDASPVVVRRDPEHPLLRLAAPIDGVRKGEEELRIAQIGVATVWVRSVVARVHRRRGDDPRLRVKLPPCRPRHLVDRIRGEHCALTRAATRASEHLRPERLRTAPVVHDEIVLEEQPGHAELSTADAVTCLRCTRPGRQNHPNPPESDRLNNPRLRPLPPRT